MLVLLSLVSMAAAAPQMYSPYYQLPYYNNPYVMPYYNPLPYNSLPAAAPEPKTSWNVVSPYPIQQSRLITFSSKLTSAGKMAVTAAGDATLGNLLTATTVEGDVEFQQNVVTQDLATYLIYLKGVEANMKYKIGVAADCDGVGATEIDEITTPWFLINGAHITGATDKANINGEAAGVAGARTIVTGMRFVVMGPSPATTVIGCSAANLV